MGGNGLRQACRQVGLKVLTFAKRDRQLRVQTEIDGYYRCA
jgi:hypothetical protein